MIQPDAVYTLCMREVLRFARTKTRLVGGLGTPLLFLVVLGSGLDGLVNLPGVSYFQFLSPGVLSMVLLFSAMFSGINVVYDRQFGFLKEILVSPVSRLSIVLGRALGGSIVALAQALLFLVITLFFGVNLSWGQFLAAVGVMFVSSFSFTLLGLAIASRMEDFQGFQLIVNFVMMPMFFFSGALFPLDKLPAWLKAVSFVNPMTYAVDSLRAVMVDLSSFGFPTSFGVLLGFTILALFAATWLFSQKD